MRKKGTPRRLFFDIETSPNVVYSWGASWKERLSTDNIVDERRVICISYKWENDDKVRSLDWGKKMCDKKLLKDFIKIANSADEIVAHNADRYDVPFIKGRCFIHGIPTFPKYQTIDTLKRTRANLRLNSNRLDYIGEVTGLGRKNPTSYQLWKDCMTGDPDALRTMVEYCEQDVILLEQVHERLKNFVPHQSHRGVLDGGEKWSCPECGSTEIGHHKTRTTPTGIQRFQMQCKNKKCRKFFTISGRAYMNYLKNRLKRK